MSSNCDCTETSNYVQTSCGLTNCPNCCPICNPPRCPCCGRRLSSPWYPPWYQYPYPYYEPYTITWGGTTNDPNITFKVNSSNDTTSCTFTEYRDNAP